MNILLADHHQMMRDGLRAVLEREPGLRVVGEAGDGHAAVDLCLELHPDLVVMDVSLPMVSGIDATRRLRDLGSRARVLALAVTDDRRSVEAMFEAGAWGYLVKSAPASELVRAIRAIEGGEKYVGSAVAGAVVDALLRHPHGHPAAGDTLTVREREVLQLLAEGLSSKEIATRMQVAPSTVETHRKQVMAKLALHSVAELTKYAIREGLTPLE